MMMEVSSILFSIAADIRCTRKSSTQFIGCMHNEVLKCETLGAVCQKTVQQPKALHRMIASSDYSHKYNE